MGIYSMRRVVGLLWKLMEGDPAPAVLPMRVQKIPFSSCCEKSGRLPRSAPKAEGVEPEALRDFLREISEDREENLHSITVLRHGKVIAERSFAPYDRGIWHVTHSLCKTITALAIGILIGEGKLRLGDRIVDIFPEKCTAAARLHYGQLSVFHLLTMTSGVSFGEMQSVTETEWVQGFLDSPPLFRVGEKFHYNSMNTYMLSAIICAKTGRTLTEFLNEWLFQPMGIRKFHWETCPNGIEKGGWGLYLLQEDAAKLGQLILNQGTWSGTQLVPAVYVKDMCSWHSDPPKEMGGYGYGYQCWGWARPGSIHMSGLFGQSVLVVPDLDMVIAANAGNGRLFGESNFLKQCECLFNRIEKGNAAFRDVNIERESKEIVSKDPIPPANRALNNLCCFFDPHGARLLPVFMQLLGNSYTVGIQRISFYCEDHVLYMEVTEGKEKNLLEIGFSAAAQGKVTANGEEHLAAVSGNWEDDTTLRVDIAFLEQANTRHLRFCFENDSRVRLQLWETPGKEAILNGVLLLLAQKSTAKRLTEGRWKAKLDKLAEPEVWGELQK